MITTVLYILFYLVVAVILVEVIFWILGLILPAIISPRIRGLLYALALILVLLYALGHFGALR
jgi:hypothetical protein